MALKEGFSLALLVRGAPYQQRDTRSKPDLALASAALDFRLEIYLLGQAALQLATGKDGTAAMLPPGYRAWAAVPDLTEARVFAETKVLEGLKSRGVEMMLAVEGLDAEQMKTRWRSCDQVIVL